MIFTINGSDRLIGIVLAALVSLGAASTSAVAEVSVSRPAKQRKIEGKPAISAVLAAFSRYEVVGINAGHDDKDTDDFILALIRDPSFPSKVNDIAVECGNSLYQSTLDRYIAGEQVSFNEAQKVWRDTTQQMCGQSAFYEELFPLVRAINLGLPPEQRIRMLAADPPVNWPLIHTQKDFSSFTDRDGSIASVMEKEVLSKHRKALMLFGIFHLIHGSGPGDGNAVTLYEKRFPHSTFVISDLGYFGSDTKDISGISFAHVLSPALINTNGTFLGTLGIESFKPIPISTDEQCNVVDPFSLHPRRVMSNFIDAFLYVGPQNVRLKEVTPADVALDTAYTAELLRRNEVVGLPGARTVAEFNQQTIAGAATSLLTIERLPDARQFYPMIRQLCLQNMKKPDAKAAH